MKIRFACLFWRLFCLEVTEVLPRVQVYRNCLKREHVEISSSPTVLIHLLSRDEICENQPPSHLFERKLQASDLMLFLDYLD